MLDIVEKNKWHLEKDIGIVQITHNNEKNVAETTTTTTTAATSKEADKSFQQGLFGEMTKYVVHMDST